MKKVILVVTLALLASFSVSAQMGLYETLKANGKDAKYVRFDKVIEADDHKSSGKYKIDAYGTSVDTVTAQIETKFASRNESGFNLTSLTSKKVIGGISLTRDYMEPVGYPVIMLRHSREGEGDIAIGNYIFSLNGISKDGTSYKYISRMYIKLDSEEEAKKHAEESEKAKDEPKKKKKKMSLGERMKASREKMLMKMAGAMGGGNSIISSPEYKRASGLDLRKMITNYLKEIHAKQAANPQTAKFNALVKEVKAYKDNESADITAYNDSIKATPEYKKMKAHQKWMAEKVNLTVKNESDHSYWVGSSEEAFIITEIGAGSSRTLHCDSNLYYYSSNTKGLKGTLFNSKDTNCGGSVTLH